MKKINEHVIFVSILLVLSLFYLNNIILHKNSIPLNIHYINDLTFVSYNVKEALKNNELPLWTPYFYSGHPLMAIPENYMFDLNFLFIYLFGNIYLAMNLSLIFYFFLAGLGMYILSNIVAENKKAAFISAIVYMFNGFVHSFIIDAHINLLEGYALIPFIFLFVYKALRSKNWLFYSVLAGIFFALQVLSGSMIFFFYTALIIFFYMAFNLINKKLINTLIKSFFIGAAIAMVSLSLASIKLLPALEFTKMSSRAANVSFNEFLGQPVSFKDIISLAVTNIGYAGFSAAIGIASFIFLIYGLRQYKKRIVMFSLIIIAFSLLFATGTFVASAMYKVPGFEKLRHVERSLVLFVFAGSVLAGHGFALLSDRLKKFSMYLKRENLFFICIIFLVLLELLFLQKFPMSLEIIEPENIKVLQYISDDNSLFRTMNLGLNDIIGHAGYNYYAQKGISEAKGGGGIWVNDYVVFLSVAQQTLNSKILGVLNIKYIITDKKFEAGSISYAGEFEKCKACEVANAFGPYLYRNEHFLPRYYVVPNGILVLGDNNIARQLIYSMMLQNFEPKSNVLIEGTRLNDYDIDFLKRFKVIFLARDSVDQNSIAKLREYASQGGLIVPDILNGQNSISNEDINKIFNKTNGSYKEINAGKYSNNKVVLNLNGEKGWLVASERFAHFPGWKASIDGKNIQIFKADNVISSLYLDGEKGSLAFEYKPYSYKKGKSISLAAAIAVIAYFGYFVYMKKSKSGGSNQA